MPDHNSAGSYFLTLIMSAVIRKCLPGTSITDLVYLEPNISSCRLLSERFTLCLPELVPNASYCKCLSEWTKMFAYWTDSSAYFVSFLQMLV